MGRTNIRSGYEILHRASDMGEVRDITCLIPDATIPGIREKLIVIVSGPTDKHEFDLYVPLVFRATSANRWTCFPSAGAHKESSPPSPVPIPRVFVGRGMTAFWEPPFHRVSEPKPEPPKDILYIAVLAGNQGAELLKYMIASTARKLASFLFSEALNGYSTVFTGACFESEWKSRNVVMEWKMVQTLAELEELRDKRHNGGAKVAGIVC